ncbi:MAG TPA: divalent-cation tolerance protein CutA [Deltaproteobacteria bacterium]|nr:divalent-cation tolerance protein CutA [Deltaproteobacteria bacterium]
MQPYLIYMTAGSLEEAEKIGKALVGERLAACVNIIEHMRSFYWWEGTLQEDHEVVMIAKTTSPLVDSLVERVKSLHSYRVPCIVSVPISGGNPDFLEWIDEVTR